MICVYILLQEGKHKSPLFKYGLRSDLFPKKCSVEVGRVTLELRYLAKTAVDQVTMVNSHGDHLY